MVLNIINGNFEFVKSWQKSSRPIGAKVLFIPFWYHSKPHTKTQLEWLKKLAQLDNQYNIMRETYKILLENSNKSFPKEWNGMYVSVSHSLILPLETDWETTLLGH